MTTTSLRQMQMPGLAPSSHHYVQGWTVSFLVHGLIVVCAMLLLSDLKLVPQPEPFKWDVAMVQPTTPVSPAPQPPAPAQQASRPSETRPVQTNPVVQPVQRPQPIQRVVHQETRELRPIVRPTSEPQPIAPAQQVVPLQNETVSLAKNEPVERPKEAQQKPIANPKEAQHQLAPTQEIVPLQSETVPVAQSEPVVREPQHEPLVRETVSEPITTTPAPPQAVSEAREKTSRSTPIAEAGIQTEAPVVGNAPAAVDRQTMVRELPVQARPATRPDYSWLAEALWNRVERMKRYPYLARMNRWEGKVILEAVVRDDGHVLNLKVAQSSGYAVLDKDAMEVLQKASPLSLKHPLGQSEVVVQVPISYRLER